MNGDLNRLRDAAAAVTQRAVWSLSPVELVARLEAMHTLTQIATADVLALIREADGRGLPRADGASSTKAWLRGKLHLSARTCHRMVELAKRLDSNAPTARDALAAGQLNLEQATAIADTIAALPDDIEPDLTTQAEQLLVEQAADLDPQDLRTAGRHILAHLAPQLVEEHERKQLEKAEKRAHERRSLTLSSDGDGGVRLRGLLDVEAAAVIRAALDPLSGPTGSADQRTPAQRRADALTEVCQLALSTQTLPANGGDRPAIVVTVDYNTLTTQLRTGTLDTGERLSPDAIRRLACDARIIPAVMNSHGQVLNLGRERRLFTGPIRRALILRDGGCTFPGCNRPPRWCHAHHITSWLHEGETNLDNGVLLCRYHHRLIHCGDWQVRIAADGLPEFIPPQWIDPERKPQRNHRHRRPPPSGDDP